MEHTIISDTICAVSTAPGRGGIAVVRVSGPDAINVADKLWHGKPLAGCATHTAHLGQIVNPDNNRPLDQAVATIFRSPHSFTGEDVVEIAVHGSTYIQSELLRLLVAAGARIAQPGEFTRRAFSNGRIDLTQAEAVADIIAASSAAAHRLAIRQLNGQFARHIESLRQQLLELASLLELELDFSEEDVTFAPRDRLADLTRATLDTVERLADTFSAGTALRRGIPVAIVGEPNAGKSSLLNALLRHDRAIVSDIPGTTRDTIEETADIGPYTFRFIDTAGLRHTDDPIETLGIDRAIASAADADIILWLVPRDASPTLTEHIRRQLDRHRAESTTLLILHSKADTATDEPAEISMRRPETIERLRQTLISTAEQRLGRDDDETPIVTNARHHAALTAAAQSLRRTAQGIADGTYTDLIAQDLRQALHHLSTITGTITTPDILQSIFTDFCIGK